MAYVYLQQKTFLNSQTGKTEKLFDKKGRPVMHRKYRFQYLDRYFKRKTKTGYEDKRKTEKLAQRIEDEEEKYRKGYEVPLKNHEQHANSDINKFGLRN